MYIYKITNKINRKTYIGQTRRCINVRFIEHCRDEESAIGRAIQKDGVENFTIEEIGGANSFSELNYQEWLLIHLHNCISPNGYNLKEGGNYKNCFSNKTISKISENSTKMWKRSGHLEKYRQKTGTTIKCLNTGLEYDSIKYTAQCMGLHAASIGYSLKNNALYKGLCFVYLSNYTEGRDNEIIKEMAKNTITKLSNRKNRSKPIRCLETEQIFDSAVEAGRALGLLSSSISKAAKNNKKHKNYTFKYLGEKYVEIKLTSAS